VESALRQRLGANLDAVEQRIAVCAGARRPGLLAVTKSVPPPVALELGRLLTARGAGPAQLGENRLESLQEKVAAFAAAEDAPATRWHFIGRIQRNKARRIARLADELHGVDSLALVETLERVCAEEGRRPRIYLQLKLADDPAKGGLTPAELTPVFEAARAADHLELAGLMTMPPFLDDPAENLALAERCFRQTLPGEAFADGRPLLSMGMSADLEAAVAAGSDWLRIGRALFRELPPSELKSTDSSTTPAGSGEAPLPTARDQRG
jgi:pyridoxal phosphate enzyme (YggS family)